jgi:hypothetical protein
VYDSSNVCPGLPVNREVIKQESVVDGQLYMAGGCLHDVLFKRVSW